MPDASLMKAFATLAGVVGFLGLILFVLKKVIKKNKKIENQIDLQIISKISLQPKSHIYLIKAGEQTLLVGATDHNINTLADLSPNERPIPSFTSETKRPSRIQTPQAELTQDLENSLSFGSFIKSAFKRSVN